MKDVFCELSSEEKRHRVLDRTYISSGLKIHQILDRTYISSGQKFTRMWIYHIFITTVHKLP
jgi:hypothetical protein